MQRFVDKRPETEEYEKPMSDAELRMGGLARVRQRGADHVGQVVALSRSRVTVRYVDAYGDERVVRASRADVAAVDSEDAA
ncbi:MAG: hypothetical protein WAV90_13860 [Gordonia amarae]